jgi:hypothetical protein
MLRGQQSSSKLLAFQQARHRLLTSELFFLSPCYAWLFHQLLLHQQFLVGGCCCIINLLFAYSLSAGRVILCL